MIKAEPPQTRSDLIANADRIAGMSLQELADSCQVTMVAHLNSHKGWVGQLVEYALGASAGSRPEPDFPNIGVELKSIPVDKDGKPRESTYVCVANLVNNQSEGWQNSLVYKKLRCVLWVPIESGADIPLAERRVGQAILWQPNAEELEILAQDWQELSDMIHMGELEKITAKIGQYLQIRPKGANRKSLCWGIDAQGNRIKTLPRGFYLRTSFTRCILRSDENELSTDLS